MPDATPAKKRRREKTLLWHLIAALCLPLLTLMSRYPVIDGEKLPKTGAFILAPNHYSEIDPVIMGRFMWKLGRVPRFLAKASVFKVPVLGAVLRWSGQIPVERDGRTRTDAPLKAAQQLVDQELAIIIYPEGSLTRDPDLWPMRGKSGAVRMALQAGVPIIPAAHWGTQTIMARYSKKISFFPRKTVTCKIGDPVDLSDLAGRPLDQATLTEGTERVMEAIAQLLGDLRGETPPPERWNPVKKGQSETGAVVIEHPSLTEAVTLPLSEVAHDSPRIAVLGAGSWGTTFAKVLADGGSDVLIWARRREVAHEITETHRNSGYLPGINLPSNLRGHDSLERVLDRAEQVYLSVPSQSLRSNLASIRDILPPEVPVVSLMKGVERGTGMRMSEVIAEELRIDPARIAVVSGPNLALEIAKKQPTAAVVASVSHDTAVAVALVSSNEYFRSFVNTDVIGTEFGGVLKNLIAVAVGIADGVGYGENTKASIITRGLVELTHFAVAFGARAETMTGLAGLGDLIATCESPLSRNNTAGRLLGQGYAFEQVIAQMNQTAEGLSSVGPVLELAATRGVTMPIVAQVARVLEGTLDPRELAPHLATDADEPQGE